MVKKPRIEAASTNIINDFVKGLKIDARKCQSASQEASQSVVRSQQGEIAIYLNEIKGKVDRIDEIEGKVDRIDHRVESIHNSCSKSFEAPMRPSTPDYKADYDRKIKFKASATGERYNKALSEYEKWLDDGNHENTPESLDDYILMMRDRPKGLSYESQIRSAVSLKYGISPTEVLGRGRHEKKSHRCLT